MNTLRRILTSRSRRVRAASNRFDRYYVGVLESGSGYPTADEARQDLRNYDKSFPLYGWPR